MMDSILISLLKGWMCGGRQLLKSKDSTTDNTIWDRTLFRKVLKMSFLALRVLCFYYIGYYNYVQRYSKYRWSMTCLTTHVSKLHFSECFYCTSPLSKDLGQPFCHNWEGYLEGGKVIFFQNWEGGLILVLDWPVIFVDLGRGVMVLYFYVTIE